MATFDLKSLELMIGAYEQAINSGTIEEIERWSDAVERAADASEFKDHRRLMAIHTRAEQRVEELRNEGEVK